LGDQLLEEATNDTVLGTIDGEPTWVSQYRGMMPDYANIEDTNNLWSGSTDSWVATKAGFAAWYVREGNGVIEAYVFINGVAVGGGTNSNHSPAGNWNGIIAFDEGDVISRRAGNDSGIYLYYIPPKAITPPELNENYSTNETNTGKRWVDGKLIYSKVIYRNINAVSFTYTQGVFISNLFSSSSYVDEMIKIEWSGVKDSKYSLTGSPSYVNTIDNVALTFYYYASENNLYYAQQNINPLTDLTITMEYTKK
ncbi:MAG: hypothetical protein LBJ43_01445, partial [Propionibacteriaceae bacterium]|nr:hypothetical protein [Propionibacteriaceae bacterium]